MSEAPKLYTNKPKKAQLKQFQEQQQKAQEFPSSSSSLSSSMGPQSSAPPPQQPPKESFARRYKFVWPMLLAVNVAVGAYFVMRTKKKQTDVEEEVAATPISTEAATTTLVPEKDQQRELFKWLLEEKRKVKTKDPEEKKRIDEEKAILKQFIRAKSIPSI
ncbi:uncharacterized protein LOC121246232 isoform X2 [Juglans microcarpa x Juglans regia]|uniref:uncharacterized protein LOC121246232 isoform X2 n=1 Tax=Juglans microcarpa x Juglans regia TaxID=2249226 RepID=UPI001B7F5534|nr:uncharacterized protein LOC121246232 isoform X2 [Juglans microcarpa x Juglans regia]